MSSMGEVTPPKTKLKRLAWGLLAALSVTPWISSPIALLMGAAFGLTVGNPLPVQSKKLTRVLLQMSVVGLGAAMDLRMVGAVGIHGIAYTVTGIVLTLGIGHLLGRFLGTSRDLSLLISVGTAICGGSAIAALAPVIKAKHHDITVALATVFILNAVALLGFPWIGHALGLNERAFGLWCALAVHDTSSVVGATLQYGKEALEVGTTVKLARALWIAPLTLGFAWFVHSRDKKKKLENEEQAKIQWPWFILGFLGVAALVTYVPNLKPLAHWVEYGARRGLVVTLFLIGSNISRESLRAVGIVPLIQGIVLWVLVAAGSLLGIWTGLVQV